MVAVVPGFVYKQIPRNYSSEHWDWSNGLVLHVVTGTQNSMFGWFSDPNAQASSHWWVNDKGQAEQYLDPDNHIAWTQGNGNNSYHSVETGGDVWEKLTDAQLDKVAAIYRWGHDHFGWPYQLAEKPGDKGLGWHGMGAAYGWGHPDCPGELRKAQRSEILRRAQNIGSSWQQPPLNNQATTATTQEENDMQRTDTITRPDGHQGSLEQMIGYMDMRLERMEAAIMGRGIPVQGYDDMTDLATEAAYNRSNVAATLRASGMSDADVARVIDAIAQSTVQVDVSVRGQQA